MCKKMRKKNAAVALFILRVNQNHRRRRLQHSSTKPEGNFFSGVNLIFPKQKSYSRKTENNSINVRQISSFCAAAPTTPLLLYMFFATFGTFFSENI